MKKDELRAVVDELIGRKPSNCYCGNPPMITRKGGWWRVQCDKNTVVVGRAARSRRKAIEYWDAGNRGALS